jgi:MoaA/NifB/PqqE/SkfB family radical SAM enzyme
MGAGLPARSERNMNEHRDVEPATGALGEAAGLIERERIASEVHHWVRLTRRCNNRCSFCLDAASHDGTHVPRDELIRQLAEGRRRGATRLILSGGEATIHPDFVALVALGRRLGYTKIQTITNGRMFVYPAFLTRCVAAGLSEITFSFHGDSAQLHDSLVGVPGAFEQALSGLRAVLVDGRPVVNVDVCLNRRNVDQLPRLLEFFINLGVREFDLLHLVPFGRAFDNAESMLYDIDSAWPAFQQVLELSRRPDLHIWFNRFPPPFLEGYEVLIQDPVKIHDEVRGRWSEFTECIRTGKPLGCWEPKRCERCYLHGFCSALQQMLRDLAEASYEIVRFDIRSPARPPFVPLHGVPLVWVRANDVETALSLAASVPGQGVALELEDTRGLERVLAEQSFGGKRLVRVFAACGRDLDRLLHTGSRCEVVALLTPEIRSHLEAVYPAGAPRLALRVPSYARASEAVRLMSDLPQFFQRYEPILPVENVPACIARRLPRHESRLLPAELVDERGRLNLSRFTEHYIRDLCCYKSRRCSSCAVDSACPGAHVNLVRALGFAVLRPEV